MLGLGPEREKGAAGASRYLLQVRAPRSVLVTKAESWPCEGNGPGKREADANL